MDSSRTTWTDSRLDSHYDWTKRDIERIADEVRDLRTEAHKESLRRDLQVFWLFVLLVIACMVVAGVLRASS